MSKPIFSAPVWANLLRGCGVASATAGKWSSVFSATLLDTSFSAGWRKELPDFLGQILHESVMLERLEENLNYTTPQRLMQVWPKRFPTVESALPYVRQPQKLANFVYGSRLGNVNGDGWTYRGSGLIMCTGLDNFRLVQDATGIGVCSNPDALRKPDGALSVALAWWEKRVPDAAMGNRQRVRRVVNGGDIGLADTIRLSNKAEEVLRGLVP